MQTGQSRDDDRGQRLPGSRFEVPICCLRIPFRVVDGLFSEHDIERADRGRVILVYLCLTDHPADFRKSPFFLRAIMHEKCDAGDEKVLLGIDPELLPALFPFPGRVRDEGIDEFLNVLIRFEILQRIEMIPPVHMRQVEASDFITYTLEERPVLLHQVTGWIRDHHGRVRLHDIRSGDMERFTCSGTTDGENIQVPCLTNDTRGVQGQEQVARQDDVIHPVVRLLAHRFRELFIICVKIHEPSASAKNRFIFVMSPQAPVHVAV